MTCYTPNYIWLRTSYPINKPDEETLKKLNKPHMTATNGWQRVKVPCGTCEGCRLAKAAEWGTRAYCEMKYHESSYFLTITYNNNNLPINEQGKATLKYKEVQDFLKRYRKQLSKKNIKIKYISASEYGEKKGRPHYHFIVFGHIPEDLKVYKINKLGQTIYKSKFMQDLWGKGFITIGEANTNTANYVARYCHKKNGIEKLEREYYDTIDEKGRPKTTWRIKPRKDGKERERIRVSGGIGLKYWLENKEKIIRNSGIFIKMLAKINNVMQEKVKLRPIPRYFLKKWNEENWEDFEEWKYKSLKQAEKNRKQELKMHDFGNVCEEIAEIMLDKLKIKEKQRQAKQLKRTLELEYG